MSRCYMWLISTEHAHTCCLCVSGDHIKPWMITFLCAYFTDRNMRCGAHDLRVQCFHFWCINLETKMKEKHWTWLNSSCQLRYKLTCRKGCLLLRVLNVFSSSEPGHLALAELLSLPQLSLFHHQCLLATSSAQRSVYACFQVTHVFWKCFCLGLKFLFFYNSLSFSLSLTLLSSISQSQGHKAKPGMMISWLLLSSEERCTHFFQSGLTWKQICNKKNQRVSDLFVGSWCSLPHR